MFRKRSGGELSGASGGIMSDYLVFAVKLYSDNLIAETIVYRDENTKAHFCKVSKRKLFETDRDN